MIVRAECEGEEFFALRGSGVVYTLDGGEGSCSKGLVTKQMDGAFKSDTRSPGCAVFMPCTCFEGLVRGTVS